MPPYVSKANRIEGNTCLHNFGLTTLCSNLASLIFSLLNIFDFVPQSLDQIKPFLSLADTGSYFIDIYV